MNLNNYNSVCYKLVTNVFKEKSEDIISSLNIINNLIDINMSDIYLKK